MLRALAGAPSCHLVGVVTSVNDGVARAAVARGWMRRCGVSDEVLKALKHGGIILHEDRWGPRKVIFVLESRATRPASERDSLFRVCARSRCCHLSMLLSRAAWCLKVGRTNLACGGM
jgi:hypothetical protein